MNVANRQSREFFEARYQSSIDPWRFGSSAYERDRYQATLDALKRPSYRRGFEPGCSIGVLTAALAARVGKLSACDLSHTAVARAQQRCRTWKQVHIYQGDVEDGPPPGWFDLMIFSELGYYFSPDRLRSVVCRLTRSLEPGGEFVAVHWLGVSPDHLLHGDAVHGVLAEHLPLERIGGTRHAGFRLDSWRRTR
jgi:SAM-dependent methyltransferase